MPLQQRTQHSGRGRAQHAGCVHSDGRRSLDLLTVSRIFWWQQLVIVLAAWWLVVTMQQSCYPSTHSQEQQPCSLSLVCALRCPYLVPLSDVVHCCMQPSHAHVPSCRTARQSSSLAVAGAASRCSWRRRTATPPSLPSATATRSVRSSCGERGTWGLTMCRC